MQRCDFCHQAKPDVKWVYKDPNICIHFPLCVECRSKNVEAFVNETIQLGCTDDSSETVELNVKTHYGLV